MFTFAERLVKHVVEQAFAPPVMLEQGVQRFPSAQRDSPTPYFCSPSGLMMQ